MKMMRCVCLLMVAVLIVPASLAGENDGMLCGEEGEKPVWIMRFEIVDKDTHRPIPRAMIKTSGRGEHEMSWPADRDGVSVLVVTKPRGIPSSGSLEITARRYRYHTEKIERDSFEDREHDRRILLTGHQHNWTDMNQLPSVQEIMDKVKAKQYRVGVEKVPSGMGFDWVNYAPAIFEYRIELERVKD